MRPVKKRHSHPHFKPAGIEIVRLRSPEIWCGKCAACIVTWCIDGAGSTVPVYRLMLGYKLAGTIAHHYIFIQVNIIPVITTITAITRAFPVFIVVAASSQVAIPYIPVELRTVKVIAQYQFPGSRVAE
jgi:hypothetical protein